MNELGHKKFEGAFKGGNVAGYFNTCGSKEGWAPSTFVSSRDKPTEAKKQSIFDFMDEEDMVSPYIIFRVAMSWDKL